MEENNNQFNIPPQNNYDQNNPQNYQTVPQEEKASVGLAILSYLIPIVGLILYLTKKDSKPKTAKVCGKCALASFIINIVITIIMYAVMGATMFSALSGTDDADANTEADSLYSEDYDEDNTGEDAKETSDGTIGDYKCVVKSAVKCQDYAGKDAILVTYDFTNNSNDAISFDIALQANAYQDGIGLETAILEEDTDLMDVEIKPGVTKEVKKAYLLRDSSTELEIEISELISFSDDKIVTKVTL